MHDVHRAGRAASAGTGSTRARSRTACAPRCWRAARRRASPCATAAATATSTGRVSTPARRSAGSPAAGVTAVSQTAGPETVLCGEAELPYALLGFLTDYANGVKDEATPVETLVRMMAASGEAFAAVLGAALPLIDAPAPPGIVYRFPSSD